MSVVVASIIVIATFLRSKAKTRVVSVQSNRAKESTHNEPAYENVKLSPLPSASVINAQDNACCLWQHKDINKGRRSYAKCTNLPK